MDPDNKTQDIRYILEELLKDRGTADYLRKKLGIPDPPKNVTETTSPYYKETEALLLKPALDDMIADENHQAIEFRFEEYVGYYKPNTLYNKILQSFKYIVDHYDTPDFKYKKFRDSVSISKEESGVLISWKSGTTQRTTTPPFGFSRVHKVAEDTKWKEVLLEYLSAENVKPLTITEISLTPEQITWAESLIAEQPYYTGVVSATKIKIVPTDK